MCRHYAVKSLAWQGGVSHHELINLCYSPEVTFKFCTRPIFKQPDNFFFFSEVVIIHLESRPVHCQPRPPFISLSVHGCTVPLSLMSFQSVLSYGEIEIKDVVLLLSPQAYGAVLHLPPLLHSPVIVLACRLLSVNNLLAWAACVNSLVEHVLLPVFMAKS